ncbi:hypothetical protein KP509_38G002000 [Ceratopteris richardii]|uniref:DUF3700 domain-containing protein n=2 Tax=Ceratopteris richardii TaxID=49495 RepID=A0A8T2Q1Z5_CERRI|nr:hypothetical protein KP509_38G002000 [Ceratopteris richardii]KAH7277678.1 hypothetical protein KP509_38G002000 [Ceratopteris richardii]KAH7277679.1 hypothetical protein KP509_38G002000 [Ceratopteris richardii]KAH7277681.1 hypothetical protein KP509_38G002000 [Ceratopteris richardii]KAH7277682.1 hypothetical protein KP509_38G002000 [Ceratopteris richardii]
MLAVFHGNVANAPQELCSPSSRPDERKPGLQILETFTAQTPGAVRLLIRDVGGMAYTHHKEALLRPRSFASVDGIFCMFQGNLENLATLRQEYGLGKSITEVMLIIEAYRTLRDRGPFPPDKVVADLDGQFTFILYDSTNKNIFVALDGEGKVPFYWGTAADGCVAFSDIPEVLESGCGKSFAPFPTGCYFSSHMGLQSYEHPLQPLKPILRVDSQGQRLGAEFEVDMGKKDLKKQESMHRVGSEANWAESI